jgi:predicted amidohydrolase
MHELFAAIWKVRVTELHALPVSEKKAKLNRAIVKAFAYMKAVSKRMNAQHPVYVFAAPEYYWIQPVFKLYNAAEKNDIFDWMQSLSSSQKGLIMFPGTVNWQVPKQVPGNKAYDGYNTAPAFLNGNLLLDYDKKYNDGEVDKAANGVAEFISGGRGGDHMRQDFMAEGLHFGLDICGDLNAGQLSLTLAGQKVDVMVVISASMAHHFGNSQIGKIPVRDGGAFVQCDSSTPSESEFRNGVWAVNRGKGMHGRDEGSEVFRFRDMDGTGRIIAIPVRGNTGDGPTVDIPALGGFGSVKSLKATGIERSGQKNLKKFSVTLPGGKRSQTALFEMNQPGSYKVTLSRRFSKPTEIQIKSDPLDLAGTTFSGTGNVTKISKLLPDPDLDGLVAYFLPIPPAV